MDQAKKTYFHCAPIPLSEGSIIENGNWGRIIKIYAKGIQENTDITDPEVIRNKYHKEYIIEEIRKKHFPQKPSRFNSVFLSETFLEAQIYQIQYCQPNIIYEVEIINEEAPIHEATYLGKLQFLSISTQASNMEINQYINVVSKAAMEYWEMKNPTQHVEHLVESPIRILKKHYSTFD